MPQNLPIQFRRGTNSEWSSQDPVLFSGEPGFDTSNNILKIGDGINTWTAINSISSDIYVYAKNTTGGSLSKGQAVYVNGAQGNNPTITLAIASGEGSSSKTLGLLKQDLNDNEFGYIVSEGMLEGINTNSATAAGDPMWLSPTVSGGIVYGTGNKPLAPYHLVFLGYVIRKQINNGKVYVKIQNGFELGELHNVAVNGSANGSFLQYNSSSGLWMASSSGNFTSLSVNSTGVSVSGHTHTSSDITNFNSSVSDLLPVKDITAGTNISVSSSNGTYTVSVSGSLGLTEEQVDDRVNGLLVGGTGISLSYDDNGNSLTIATSGLQPSGDYSLNGHTHIASNITDFNSSVSGLLPVKDIIAGTNISVSSSFGSYTVSVSGSLGLTEEQVDDRVSNLLVAGTGITLTYDDNGNTLTIATSGLQPSGNYSLTGHTHSGSDITSGTIADARLSTNAQSAINLYLWSSFR